MRTLATLLALVAGALMLSSARPDAASCQIYCSTAPCFDESTCLSGCVCIRLPPHLGNCASID